MGRSKKSKEPARDFNVFFDKDIDVWLMNTRCVCSKAFNDCNGDKDEFLRICRGNGLVISYPDVFLKCYYKKNVRCF